MSARRELEKAQSGDLAEALSNGKPVARAYECTWSIRASARQPDTRHRINPLRLDAALDIKRELAPQKEILCFDRPARSECESAPAERFGDQLK